MRTCIFCGARANSVEDAWPKWLTSQFKAVGPTLMQAERGGIALPPWPLRRPELTVKRVCRKCNNGWMSRLEKATKPILQPLVAGERCVLDQNAQATITLWAIKTSMVLEGIDSEETFGYLQTERESMRAIGSIPWRTSVWIAFSLDPSLFVSSKLRHLNPEDSPMVSGLTTTIGLAHIALQVFTIRVPAQVSAETQITVATKRGHWTEITAQLWPPRAKTVAWPPRMALNGEDGITLFSERFATAGLAEAEIDTLAV